MPQDDELALGPNSLYYDVTGGIQVPDRITLPYPDEYVTSDDVVSCLDVECTSSKIK